MGTLGSYDIARSGIMTSERSLFVTGQNISNVNTPGYTRQQAMIKATNPYQVGNFQIGSGSDIQEIRQIRMSFLDNIYRNETQLENYHKTRLDGYQDVEAILGDPMEPGLQDVLNNYWDGYQELAKSPESLTVRALVKQRTTAFIDNVNHIGEQINRLHNDINTEVGLRINEVNNLGSQVAKLNFEIMKEEGTGDHANDLRDQREAAIDRLSQLVKIDIHERGETQVDITIGGQTLVYGKDTEKLCVDQDYDTVNNLYVTDVKWEFDQSQAKVGGGIIQGLIDNRDKTLVDNRNKLNTFVSTLTQQINSLQNSGFDNDGLAGADIFVRKNPLGGYVMGNITLNPALSDLNKFVASAQPNNVGDNVVANQIIKLRQQQLFTVNGVPANANDYYRSIIYDLGTKSYETNQVYTNQTKLAESADNQRKAVSGVSMDEEMSNMLKFQFAYGAATKVLSSMDEMIESLINRLGTVGR